MVILGAVAAPGTAPSAVELDGIMSCRGVDYALVRDRPERKAAWVEVGAAYGAYRLTALDRDGATAQLDGPSGIFTIRLTHAVFDEAPQLAPAVREAIVANLQAFVTAALQVLVETGADHVDYGEVVGPNRALFQLDPVAGEDYSALRLTLANPQVCVSTADGVPVRYAPEQLRVAMPAGTSLGDVSRGSGIALVDLRRANPDAPCGTFPATQLVRLR